jgi:gp6-like head-tail connector protein
MPLPDIDLCKSYLRIETTAEDSLVGEFIVEAIAFIESYIGRAILDPNGTRVFGPVRIAMPVIQGFRLSDSAPNVNMYPAGTDDLGRETNLPTPASVTGPLPMSTLPDYAQRWEPLLRRAILDTVAEFWSHRDPMVTNDSSGGGVSVTRGRLVHGLPPRVRAMLKPVLALSDVTP